MATNVDLLLYAVHAVFWSSFGLARLILRSRHPEAALPAETVPSAREEHTAPYSRALLATHMLAFGVLYFGIANAVLPRRVPTWLPFQRTIGTLVIAAGGALMVWALVYFRSWRFRAKLDVSHQLATGGPFRIVRHPIYASLDLLALGSAVWAPTPLIWAGFVLTAVGGDLRARAEEKLLERALGEPYRLYCGRTSRFIPRIY